MDQVVSTTDYERGIMRVGRVFNKAAICVIDPTECW